MGELKVNDAGKEPAGWSAIDATSDHYRLLIDHRGRNHTTPGYPRILHDKHTYKGLISSGGSAESGFRNRYDKPWNTSFTVLTTPASWDLYPGNRDTAAWNSSPFITARTRFIEFVSSSCFRQTNK